MVSYDLINSPKGKNYIYVMRLSLSLAGGAVQVTPKLKTDDGGSPPPWAHSHLSTPNVT